ncbi:MAG: hypothetical protein ACEY3H_01730 [Wolbachia sp.]
MTEADTPHYHANWNPDFFLYSMVETRNRNRSDNGVNLRKSISDCV